ncbi:CBS domain-containing protein [Algibacillus agarilyticus]|uniref:CBS domain-containing protein n=1 Tax=Algibacillus agarilyticus TaxID=2234133 RepID=UPI000DD0D45C|nr:CBS domain-containing protein [Algibacillus agarilyticus]
MTMQFVKDIMTTEVKYLTTDSNLLDAHNLTRDSGIRHIPILDADTLCYKGLLSQKAMVAKVFSIVSTYGTASLERREKKVLLTEVMSTDNPTASANDDLKVAAEHFINKRFGSLPVLDDENKLIGIISSSDFVSLALDFLLAQDKLA